MLKKRSFKGTATLAAFIIPLILISAGPAASKTDHTLEIPSFHRIAVEFIRASEKLGAILIGKKEFKTRPMRAVLAKTKPARETSRTPSKAATPAVEPAPKPTAATVRATELDAAVPRIQISGPGDFVAGLDQGRREVFSASKTPAVAYSEGKYFLIESDKTLAVSTTPIKFAPAAGGSFLTLPSFVDMNWNGTVNLNAFRGTLEVVYSATSDRLWVVNELKLEDYLRGIAEAKHDSPDEHLRTMAILSRSYVVHHYSAGGRHDGEPFHLKNSRNGNGDDQVYRGYYAETRQPRIARAAADTAGIVVTYNGAPVITPYSSRADGRTRSPAEAGWNVDWPWVVSVPDPDTAGMTRLGHGVGLSGYGSRKRAERGDSAAEITGYYFPGTALGRTETASTDVRVSIYSIAPR